MQFLRHHTVVAGCFVALSVGSACGTPQQLANTKTVVANVRPDATTPATEASPDAASVAAQSAAWVGGDAMRATLLANARPLSSDDCRLHWEPKVGFRLGGNPVLDVQGAVATNGGQPVFLPGFAGDVTATDAPDMFQVTRPDGTLLVAVQPEQVMWALNCNDPGAVPKRFSELDGADFRTSRVAPDGDHAVFRTTAGLGVLSLRTGVVTQQIATPRVSWNLPWYGDDPEGAWDLGAFAFGVDGLRILLGKPSPTCDPDLAESQTWHIPYAQGQLVEDPHRWLADPGPMRVLVGADGVVWLEYGLVLWRSDDDGRTFAFTSTSFNVIAFAMGSKSGEMIAAGVTNAAAGRAPDADGTEGGGYDPVYGLWHSKDNARTWRPLDVVVELPDDADDEGVSDEVENDLGARRKTRTVRLAEMLEDHRIADLWMTHGPEKRLRMALDQLGDHESGEGDRLVFERIDGGGTWRMALVDVPDFGHTTRWMSKEGEVTLEQRAAGLTRVVAGSPPTLVFVPSSTTRRVWVEGRTLAPDGPATPIGWAQYDAAKVLLGKGRGHMTKKAWDAAIAAFTEALALDPDDGEALFELARAEALAGRKVEAVRHIEALRKRGGHQALTLLDQASTHVDFKGLRSNPAFRRATAVIRPDSALVPGTSGGEYGWPAMASDRAERLCLGLPKDDGYADPPTLAYARFDCETGVAMGSSEGMLGGTVDGVLGQMEARPFVRWRTIEADDPARAAFAAWGLALLKARGVTVAVDPTTLVIGVAPSGRLAAVQVELEVPGRDEVVERVEFGPYPGGAR